MLKKQHMDNFSLEENITLTLGYFLTTGRLSFQRFEGKY